ncbi:MAG: hypothetical protein HC820_09835 [Hydrococcus sp. RM1_1_31]|nr:hypothetical protein [Hydrococcus sp. RM1_1_31]
MTIHALVAGRIIDLLSISLLGSAIVHRLQGKIERIVNASVMINGLAFTVMVQVVFSQWSLMNDLSRSSLKDGYSAQSCPNICFILRF